MHKKDGNNWHLSLAWVLDQPWCQLYGPKLCRLSAASIYMPFCACNYFLLEDFSTRYDMEKHFLGATSLFISVEQIFLLSKYCILNILSCTIYPVC
jgi:hypothetical protein